MEELPVFFSSSVESVLVHAVRGQLSVNALKEIRDAGIDLGRPLQAAYPVEVWERAMGIAARALAPADELDGWYQLGLRFLTGMERTLIGAAMIQLGRVVGVERTLLRLNRNARNSNNFVDAAVTVPKPGEADVRIAPAPKFRGKLGPAPQGWFQYYRGVLRSILDKGEPHAALREVALLESDRGARSARYQLRWRS